MCNIFKCNRAGKYIGFYNNLSEAVYHNPNPQRDWFFTNGETLSVWMYNGDTWINTNRSFYEFNIIDDPATFTPGVVDGESNIYFYIAYEAGSYSFPNFNGINVEVQNPCLITLDWDGSSWSSHTYKIPEQKQNYTLPNIELRVFSYPPSYNEQSDVYGSKETNTIKYTYLEFRITENLDYINENKDSIYICLNRWKRKSKSRSYSTRGWKVINDGFTTTELAESYPNKSVNSMGYYGYGEIPFWGQSIISPIPFSDFIASGETYNGEWIKLYSMEYVMRRFIYCRNRKGELWEVVSPYHFFTTSGNEVEMMESGAKKLMANEEGKAQYATMTFGLCLGIKDFQPGSNNQHWIKGNIVPFTGIIGYNIKNGLYYNARLFGKHKFVK